MYPISPQKGSPTSRGSTRAPGTGAHRSGNAPVPHVLSVSSLTTYKAPPPHLQPPAMGLSEASRANNSARPSPRTKGRQRGAGEDPLLPRIIKAPAPASASATRRHSQQSLGSGLVGFGDASTTSTIGTIGTSAASSVTPSHYHCAIGGQRSRWLVGLPGAGSGSAMPALSVVPARRRSSQSASSAAGAGSTAIMRNVPNVPSSGGKTSAGRQRQRQQQQQQQQRTLASAISCGSSKASPHSPASPRVTYVVPVTTGIGATHHTHSSKFQPLPVPAAAASAAFARTDVPAVVLAFQPSASSPNAEVRDDDTNTASGSDAEHQGGKAAMTAMHTLASGDCGISDRVTPGGTSSLTTTVGGVFSPPTPLVALWNLTPYEEEEIRSYMPEVYFTGNIPASDKIQGTLAAKDLASASGGSTNYDDENCHYRIKTGDHIAYRYEITKELGRGTFGVVLSAIDHKSDAMGDDGSAKKDTDREEEEDGGSSSSRSCSGLRRRRVAIKLIKNKPAYTKQAKEEARLLRTLVSNDPKDEANIVRLLDTFTFRGHYALVFELLKNDLYSYMQANNYMPFTQRFIYRFAESTLKALAYLAEHGIVHCDIKPENIVVDGDNEDEGGAAAGGTALHAISSNSNSSNTTKQPSDDLIFKRLKLIDFGSSCTLDKRVFTYIQSRYYRAPEIILGIPYTSAIDMWSFGCVLCELANGMPIFPACCEGELLERMTEYLGPIPASLVAQGKRVDKFFAAPRKGSSKSSGSRSSASLAEAPQERGMLSGLSKKGRKRKPFNSRTIYSFLAPVRERNGRDEAHLFHDFVSRCLTYDPQERMTPREALQHPWMLKWRSVAEQR